MSDRFVVLTGCSGGGKSALLDELRQRGYATIEEPGRRIVQMELRSQGRALPWIDLESFANRAIEVALEDLSRAETMQGPVFFDRGLIDASVALQHATGELREQTLSSRYNSKVFFAPPWPEIFAADAERRHGFKEAFAEFERLKIAYQELGYVVTLLPKESISARADFVLSELSLNLHLASRD